MDKETLEFKSDVLDSIYIKYDIYIPKIPNGNLIQIAHGMMEHRGNYEYIASILAQNGYIVAINDHRGHGESIGGNIHLGEMGENGFEAALLDMYKLSNILKERFKPKKFILIGHSMGSLLARRFLQEYESSIDILVICGTPSPYFGISFGILFLKMCRFVGINKIGRNIAYRFSFCTFNAKYYKFDKLDSGKPSGILWVNRDENQLIKHLNDREHRAIFTINSFINLLSGLKKVFSKYPHKINKENIPILFISGEDDACGKFGKGVLSAFKHLNKQGYNNAKCILYAKARHELFLELNKDEVASDLIDYFKNH
ncbi:hypothetical protein CCY99_03660 [Helicobacter sp. 16-1353]|uniref:alpha/beta hydrolase n=1 Tax=Helicobacter sp. 16-1353 TaxID=2004996 RepID=UPI000DCDA53B|nr:alpha/beta hydrolase [Helicobacter sp. 16-1353]RAX54456.1 hypothetical protein CCY99_03660 [Helicobacter sp. 16-1353]